MAKSNGDFPKSYSKFTYKDLAYLGLEVVEGPLFPNLPLSLQPSEWLIEALDNPSTIKSGTEQAKREFMIAPIVREIGKRNSAKISVFSGYPFEVDESKGLTGSCDYLFSTDIRSLHIKAPIFFLTEAKSENLETGGAQCIAEMYAAQLFNQNAKKKIPTIFGAVTFGREWQFYRLDEMTVTRDPRVCQLTELPVVLGYLQGIVDAV